MEWFRRMVALLILVGSLLFMWTIGLPWVANHYGFALPRVGGLPSQIVFADHRYTSASACAGAFWCGVDRPTDLGCMTGEDLQLQGVQALLQVTSVPTLIGQPHPVYAAAGGVVVPGVVPSELFVLDGPNCYLKYDLAGGP